jgi:glycosyltransferase involved in cell wall biosynthesis
MDRSKIAVVIPALNEERTIATVAANAQRFGVAIVVDDGSTDRTGEWAAQAGAIVVRHERNRGYDVALNSGFARAQELGFDVAITVDADGQHDPALAIAFLAAIDAGADVVLGVRDRHQRLAETVFALAGRWKLGLRDPLCGMKAYKMSVYRALGHFDSYGSIGTELAIFAAKKGFSIAHIPIITKPRVGESRFGRRLSASKRILRALWLGLLAPSSNCRLARTQRAHISMPSTDATSFRL